MRPFARGLACALAILAPALAAQDAPEPVLVSVVLPGLRAEVMPAVRTGDRIALPVVDVLTLVDIISTVSDSGVVQFLRPRDGVAVRIDAARLSMTIARTRMSPEKRRLLTRDGTTYLDAEELGAALGARLIVNWSTLTVEITEGDALPPVDAVRRAQRNARLLAPTRVERVDASRPLARELITGGTLDYLLQIPDSRPIGSGTYVTSVGGSILGGAVEGIFAGSFDGRFADQSASWLGVWRDRPWLAQARVGDGVATGPRGVAVRGITLTNAPFLRPLDYGLFPVRAAGDSTWEVESFVNGRLVRVDTLRGAGDAVPISASYGGNVIDLVSRGPGGALLRTERFLALSANEFLPAGRTEYGLTFGQCRLIACDAVGNADLRVGLTQVVTLRAGADYQSDSTGRPVARPYGAVSWLAHPAVTASILMQSASEASAVLRWQPTIDRAILLERTTAARGDPFAIGFGRGAQERFNATFFLRPERWNDAVFLNGVFRGEQGDDGSTARARLALGVRSRIGQIFPYVQYDAASRPLVAKVANYATGFAWFATPAPSWGPKWSRYWGYMSADLRDDRRGTVSATLARILTGTLRAELTATGASGTRPLFGLRVFTDLPRARVVSSAQYDATSGYQGTHQVQGALYVDAPRRAVGAVRGPLLLRGGVGGRVFLDLDGNGEMGPDEMPLDGVAVRVGAASAVTDAQGWYHAWDVLPFEPVRVELDALSLSSPLWVPAFARLEVEPTPNSVRKVDIPVLSGGIVEGHVLQRVTDDSTTAFPGLTLTLVAENGGRTHTVTTFSDGGFVIFGLGPGTYRVQSGTAGWVIESPITIEVKQTPDGDRVRGVKIVAASLIEGRSEN